jgi:hypothetical protein
MEHCSQDLRRRAEGIAQVLDQFFPDPPVPLNHSDAFTLLCAVVLCKYVSSVCLCALPFLASMCVEAMYVCVDIRELT